MGSLELYHKSEPNLDAFTLPCLADAETSRTQRRRLIRSAATAYDASGRVVFENISGIVSSTAEGRVEQGN
jgi:hypothetical protein